jgi:hypothetical protein
MRVYLVGHFIYGSDYYGQDEIRVLGVFGSYLDAVDYGVGWCFDYYSRGDVDLEYAEDDGVYVVASDDDGLFSDGFRLDHGVDVLDAGRELGIC